MVPMIELLFLLLPVAAASGWWVGRRHASARGDGRRTSPHPAFLRGLNYLVEEQPDKAIDMLLELVELDAETVETHLALGSLFRRSGEVDRAIRIHQNLVARSHLSSEQRGDALFELGRDYLSAGLLDRAESLFMELVELRLHRERALRNLREIYEQERDWKRCLQVAEQLEALTNEPLGVEIAHYHCELAEEAQRRKDPVSARIQLTLAREADPECVRATLIEGRGALEAGEPERALALFMGVAERRSCYVPEILSPVIETLRRLGRDDIPGVLEQLVGLHASSTLILALSDEVLKRQGAESALLVLTAYLRGHADLAALERLLELEQRVRGQTDPVSRERMQVAIEVARHLLARQAGYQCEHCGFQARTLHWQCPSCRRWACVTPVHPEPIIGDEVLHERRLA